MLLAMSTVKLPAKHVAVLVSVTVSLQSKDTNYNIEACRFRDITLKPSSATVQGSLSMTKIRQLVKLL